MKINLSANDMTEKQHEYIKNLMLRNGYQEYEVLNLIRKDSRLKEIRHVSSITDLTRKEASILIDYLLSL